MLPSFASKNQFYKKIDQLPQGEGWKCQIIQMKGNILDDAGKPVVESVELWRRNPVACVEELIGNPAFKDFMAYGPERAYRDTAGETRVWDEMWTGDWWWEVQVGCDRIIIALRLQFSFSPS